MITMITLNISVMRFNSRNSKRLKRNWSLHSVIRCWVCHCGYMVFTI